MKKEYICEKCECPCWLTIEICDGDQITMPTECIFFNDYYNHIAEWREYK